MSDYNGSGYEEDQDESEDDDESCDLVLTFTSNGNAVLEEEGEAVWFSDDDDDFRELIGNEFLEADQDSATVLNYLVEEMGIVDEEEKGEVQIEQEDLDEEE